MALTKRQRAPFAYPNVDPAIQKNLIEREQLSSFELSKKVPFLRIVPINAIGGTINTMQLLPEQEIKTNYMQFGDKDKRYPWGKYALKSLEIGTSGFPPEKYFEATLEMAIFDLAVLDPDANQNDSIRFLTQLASHVRIEFGWADNPNFWSVDSTKEFDLEKTIDNHQGNGQTYRAVVTNFEFNINDDMTAELSVTLKSASFIVLEDTRLQSLNLSLDNMPLTEVDFINGTDVEYTKSDEKIKVLKKSKIQFFYGYKLGEILDSLQESLNRDASSLASTGIFINFDFDTMLNSAAKIFTINEVLLVAPTVPFQTDLTAAERADLATPITKTFSRSHSNTVLFTSSKRIRDIVISPGLFKEAKNLSKTPSEFIDYLIKEINNAAFPTTLLKLTLGGSDGINLVIKDEAIVPKLEDITNPELEETPDTEEEHFDSLKEISLKLNLIKRNTTVKTFGLSADLKGRANISNYFEIAGSVVEIDSQNLRDFVNTWYLPPEGDLSVAREDIQIEYYEKLLRENDGNNVQVMNKVRSYIDKALLEIDDIDEKKRIRTKAREDIINLIRNADLSDINTLKYLPFTITLEMLGLSGLWAGHMIHISSDMKNFLLDDTIFIISSLNHNISPEGWFTSFEGKMAASRPQIRKIKEIDLKRKEKLNPFIGPPPPDSK